MKLTEKQKRFVDEYLVTLNAAEAAKRAGYSAKTAKEIGAENLTKPNIKQVIDARLAALEKKRIATVEEVLQHLTAVMRDEVEEEVVDAKGNIVVKKAAVSDRNKAADLLLKRYARNFRLDEDEQRLKIEKLRAEVESLRSLAADEGRVNIIDDLEDDDDERQAQ